MGSIVLKGFLAVGKKILKRNGGVSGVSIKVGSVLWGYHVDKVHEYESDAHMVG